MTTALNLTIFVAFACNLSRCFSYRTTTVNNQVEWDSSNKTLECRTSNIEVWSNGNGLPLNGTKYDVTINKTGVNEPFGCSWKFELRGEQFDSLVLLYGSSYNPSESWRGDYGELSFNQQGSRLALNETYLRSEGEEIYFNCTIWQEGCRISQGCCHTESEIEVETGTSTGKNTIIITVIIVCLLISLCACLMYCFGPKCLRTKRLFLSFLKNINCIINKNTIYITKFLITKDVIIK